MNNEHSYWKQQTTDKPLYPDIEWSKPEQKAMRGRLGIIGGNKLGFTGVAENYEVALKSGIGEIRVLMPEALRKSIPITMTDVLFGSSNPSGSLSRDALNDMKATGEWSTGILLIGDAGRNSETAILYEDFIRSYTGPLIITRDAIDLIKNSSAMIVNRPNTTLVLSFAQLQKLFSAVYYPKVLTFSMQMTNLVEALHKFTISYPINILTFHNDTILVASNGDISSMPFDTPTDIWRGKIATIASIYWLWNLSKPFESITASLIKN